VENLARGPATGVELSASAVWPGLYLIARRQYIELAHLCVFSSLVVETEGILSLR
jgi:hypothetical protein